MRGAQRPMRRRRHAADRRSDERIPRRRRRQLARRRRRREADRHARQHLHGDEKGAHCACYVAWAMSISKAARATPARVAAVTLAAFALALVAIVASLLLGVERVSLTRALHDRSSLDADILFSARAP